MSFLIWHTCVVPVKTLQASYSPVRNVSLKFYIALKNCKRGTTLLQVCASAAPPPVNGSLPAVVLCASLLAENVS
jgi:hypothetical protein